LGGSGAPRCLIRIGSPGPAQLSFPGMGRLRAEGSGYVFVPVNYAPPAK
jgi:hypothetical protein